MEFKDKNILVAGLGKTGISVSRFLKKRGARVTATDTADEKKLGTIVTELRELGIKVVAGPQTKDMFLSQDLIVLSPGVPHTIAPVQEALEKNIPVIGEIELASRFIEEPMIAVTGTNGKTTTTTLLSDMLTASNFSVFTGGNIGTPLIDYVEEGVKRDFIVIEVSSFQLDTIDTFHPKVGIILNITEDHLDRYDSMDDYALSKFRIFENQEKTDTAVINAADPETVKKIKTVKSGILPFNTKDMRENGATIDSEGISIRKDGTHFFIKKEDMALSGSHNMENIAAAALSALSVGGSEEGIRSAVKNFENLSHRIEYVDTVNGVRYFDDSKATNVDAVIRALSAFEEPVTLIMGGRDKGSNYDLLIKPVQSRVKKLIVIGEAKDLITASLGKYTKTVEAATMDEAVNLCFRSAVPGEVVLLSPACASFDMYTSYSERGKDFTRSVHQLKEVQP